MREAVGGGLLFNLVVIFTSIIILLFVGIIAYAKAYTVKNKIVSIIEEHGKYDEKAIEDINVTLKDVGYKNISGYKYSAAFLSKCNEILINDRKLDYDTMESNKIVQKLYEAPDFLYCVAKNEETNGYYYTVITFVSFEFPVIGDRLIFPVLGQTRILGKTYDYD